jgi:hypothetical protein
MKEHVVYTWEQLPEYRYTQRFAYSLGRVLASLRPRWRRRVEGGMSRAAVLISRGIVLANADIAAGEEDLSPAERRLARESALEAVEISREGLTLLRSARLGSRPDIMVALELLERIEEGIRQRPAAG